MSSTTWESLPERPEGAPPQRGGPGAQHWPPWTAPVALLSAFIVAFLGGTVCFVVYAIFAGHFDATNSPPGVLMAATFLQDAAFIAVAIAFARMAGPTWAGQFGLRRPEIGRAIGWSFAIYVGYLILAGLYQLLVKVEQDKNLLDDLGTKDSTVALVFSILLVCVVAPIAEEFFFRGFFFGALRNWRGFWPAAVITGLVFGGIHIGSSPAQALPVLAILGFGLCLLYERTGSLYPCMVLHAFNNSLAFGTLQGWDWQIPLLFAGSLAAIALLVVPVARRWQPPRRTAEARSFA